MAGTTDPVPAPGERQPPDRIRILPRKVVPMSLLIGFDEHKGVIPHQGTRGGVFLFRGVEKQVVMLSSIKCGIVPLIVSGDSFGISSLLVAMHFKWIGDPPSRPTLEVTSGRRDPNP